ncbi:MAG: DUF2298 domain-containing protein [Halobacteriota archaeon]
MGALYFLLILELIGFLSLPLVSFLTKDFKDKGQFLSKQLGIVVIVFTAWLLSVLKLIEFYYSLFIGLLLLVSLSVIAFRKVFSLSLDLKKSLKNSLKESALSELVFISAFVVAVFYLMHKPEIYFAYSEDFMDFAFLKSILRTDYFPTVDPWFAGHDLIYYYFGHLISAVWIKLSGVEPQVGYNLAVAAFYSMAVQTAFGLGYNLTRKKLYGLVTVVVILVMGFISGFLQLLAYFRGSDILHYEAFSGSFTELVFHFSFNEATRIIPHTLNLYPSFTFLQGDLHAPLMSTAFQLAFIGLCLAVYRNFNLYTFFSALVFSLFFIGLDTWSFPTYFTLLVITAYFATRNRVFLLVLAAVGGIFLYTLNAEMVGIVTHRTELIQFLRIFPVFIFISITYIASGMELRSKMAVVKVTAFLTALFAGFIIGFQLAFLFVLAGLLAYYILTDRSKIGNESGSGDIYGDIYPLIVGGLAVLLLLFCELFYINDAYTGPQTRFNTVLKFHLQVWVLWGIASAFFLSRIRNRAVVAVAVFLIAVSAIHPVFTSFAMPNADYMGSTEELTLDGMKWVEEQHPIEYEAIKWLDNRSGVVLEAPGEAYHYSSRVSAFTGLPTLVGWKPHENMWGRNWSSIFEREKAAQDIYLNASCEAIKEYDVKYIFVGEAEYRKYDHIGLRYSQNLTQVYKDGRLIIYKVS